MRGSSTYARDASVTLEQSGAFRASVYGSILRYFRRFFTRLMAMVLCKRGCISIYRRVAFFVGGLKVKFRAMAMKCGKRR